MGTKQAYKVYQRTQRIQDTNISFANGMSFTNAPLSEGFSRLLVNYDFGTEDATLVPRNGLIATEHITDYSDIDLPFNSNMTLLAGNKVTHNGVEFKQIIVGEIIDKSAYDLYKGKAWVITCENNKLRYAPLHDDILGSYYCYFTKPDLAQASIHGTLLQESPYVQKIVGSFAFNNEFYFFTNDGNLRHTKFDKAQRKYITETVTPFKINQSEAQNSLYNMLLVNPYDFECTATGSIFSMTGFAPFEMNRVTGVIGNLKIRPNSGEEYAYKMYYNYPGATAYPICFHIEYNIGSNSVWFPVARDESEEYIPSSEPFVFKGIRIDSQFAQFRIYAVKSTDAKFNESNQLTTESLAKGVVLTTSFNYTGKDTTDGTTNLELKTYDLSHARGMTYWKNRLFVFGARDRAQNKIDNTVLIASDPNRPDWFPYTANADIFEEEIIYVQPMLDDLLVFTKHNLYSLTLSEDGLSWTKKHLQSDLNIKPWDLNLIRIVKNMVFFKSGNYYYMVVPKLTAASGAGLAIAPITKTITGFIDNFLTNVKQVVDDLYNYSLYGRYRERAKITFDLDLIHYYNYLDYEDVHNTYVFKVTKKVKKSYDFSTGTYEYEDTKPVLLNFSLLYNTVSRTWRIYCIESERVLQPLFMNATGHGVYGTLVEYNGNTGLQFLEHKDSIYRDSYIKQGKNTLSSAEVFKNWQYFDSGNIDQNADMKKRFREYQFKINNSSSSALEFYSGFFIDKLTRTYQMQYNEEELLDSDEQVSTIVIDAIPSHSILDPENTILYTTLGSWILGESKFPDVNIYKIRIPTSGKGYLPRTILISYNENEYELLSYATVYRQLYSR